MLLHGGVVMHVVPSVVQGLVVDGAELFQLRFVRRTQVLFDDAHLLMDIFVFLLASAAVNYPFDVRFLRAHARLHFVAFPLKSLLLIQNIHS